MKRQWICILVLALGFSACEKDIQFSPDTTNPKLVVDASIENNQPPLIVLSRSLAFFNTLSPTELTNSFVHNAQVTITENGITYPMKEVTVPLGNGQSTYYYTNDPLNPTPLVGKTGTRYQLKITTDGQVYNAETSIPALPGRTLDSIWWKKAPFSTDSTKVVVMGKVTDPPGLGNYMRYFTKVNREPYWPGYNSVNDDQIIDGTSYIVQIDAGWNKNIEVDRETYGFFHRGDTVLIKLSNIDKATYDFWRTWEFNFQSVGNPFSSPGKITGNISNNALGIFCGYASAEKRLIIPK
jgi:hypothetical protein